MTYENLCNHPMVRFTITPNFRWNHETKEVVVRRGPIVIEDPKPIEKLPKLTAPEQHDVMRLEWPYITMAWEIKEGRQVEHIMAEWPDKYYVFYLNEGNNLMWQLQGYDVVRMALIPKDEPRPCPCCGKY